MNASTPWTNEAELVRSFGVHTQPSFMLLLGAGASVSSGIPSATAMTWMFKRDLYCSETSTSIENFRDLDSKFVREALQGFIEGKDWYPGLGGDQEYAVLFERAYQAESDRRAFIRNLMSQAIPSFGYVCLAALVEANRINNILTTNFDDLVEKAITSHAQKSLFVVSPESANRLYDVKLANARFPQLFMLHGDFRYDRLQNTREEIRNLNRQMEERMLEFFRNYGLIVVGYSGRDSSVMSMLERAAADDRTFPQGFYWCVRDDEAPRAAVTQLLGRLTARGTPCGLVKITSFDELVYHLYLQAGLKHPRVEKIADTRRQEAQPFQYQVGQSISGHFITTNGIRIRQYPSSLIQFPTSIEEWDRLDSIIGTAPIVASLYQNSVLALGNRSLVSTVFGPYMMGGITAFEVTHDMLTKKSRLVFYLFYNAIGAHLTQKIGLQRLGNTYYVVPDSPEESYSFVEPAGRTITVALAGRYRPTRIGGVSCFAHPAFSYQLEYREGTLLFVLRPEILVTSDGRNPLAPQYRRIVCNEILSKQYNKQSYEQLLFWLHYLRAGRAVLEFDFPPYEEPPPVQFILEEGYSLSSLQGDGR